MLEYFIIGLEELEHHHEAPRLQTSTGTVNFCRSIESHVVIAWLWL